VRFIRCEFRRPQFALADLAGLIAAVAVACKWPFFILPTVGLVLTILLDRVGLSLVWILLAVSAFGLALGLLMKPIIVH
jgi:hypothetical protein